MCNTELSNLNLHNHGVNATKDAHQVIDVLELFAEELPGQYDHALPVSTTSTVSTVGGCIGTVGTVSTLL